MIDNIKQGFEKDQEKAAKKIAKLSKKVEELDSTSAEQQAEIANLTRKI